MKKTTILHLMKINKHENLNNNKKNMNTNAASKRQ
jgi:hypothetical protein